jgi:hypothetical protein
LALSIAGFIHAYFTPKSEAFAAPAPDDAQPPVPVAVR